MYSRQLLDMATGSGKTSIFCAIAADEWSRGGRTLVIENRDALVRQTAKRIADESGLDVDIEMAEDHASPFAPVVVASVMTLARTNRLTGFSDSHFQLIVQDEAHHSLANSFNKVASYFHYGAESLTEGWVVPQSPHPYKARILGATATPQLSTKRSLGEFYENIAYRYQLFQAVEEGWLVPLVTENIPLKIDLRGLRPGRTPNGSDFKSEDISARLVPVLEALAKQIVARAFDRKTIAFVPSVECARLLADAITRHGLCGIFVSGACLDVDEKTETYRRSGPGTVMVNCALYVEGADFPDTSCVVIARATKSVGFYRQMVGRGTRVLPGVVDGIPTSALRRQAIAESAKNDLLILDPLWISDRIDLCDAYDLYTDSFDVKQAMKKAGKLTPEAAAQGERDFLAALAKEARKHERKAARRIDPLIWALNIGDSAITNYVPETDRDRRPVTVGQAEFFKKNHIDAAKITTFGLADRIIGRYMARLEMKMATANQLSFLKQLGLPDDECVKLSQRDASATIDRILKEKRAH